MVDELLKGFGGSLSSARSVESVEGFFVHVDFLKLWMFFEPRGKCRALIPFKVAVVLE